MSIDVETTSDDYERGYKDGESSATADLNMLLEGLDLPFDPNEMDEFDAVRKLAGLLT
jgi:hypothetical protein